MYMFKSNIFTFAAMCYKTFPPLGMMNKYNV